jgi:hypothetical protein
MSVWILQCQYEISDASHSASTKILEILTCGGFPIRSARESASTAIWTEVRKLCRYFSKFVTFIHWQYRAAPLRDQRRKTIRFLVSPLAAQSASSQTTPISGNAKLLAMKQTRRLADVGNQGHQIVVKLWFTIVECFSRSICLSATTMRMTEGDRHYIRPTISRDEFDNPLSSILSRAAPTA